MYALARTRRNASTKCYRRRRKPPRLPLRLASTGIAAALRLALPRHPVVGPTGTGPGGLLCEEQGGVSEAVARRGSARRVAGRDCGAGSRQPPATRRAEAALDRRLCCGGRAKDGRRLNRLARATVALGGAGPLSVRGPPSGGWGGCERGSLLLHRGAEVYAAPHL